MKPTLKLDMREFNAALSARVAATRRTLPEVVNQTAFNVAARAMHYTKPNTWGSPNAVTAERGKVNLYLRHEMGSTPGAHGTYTPSKGNKGKRGARRLRRVLLIAQAAFFKKHGYGIGKGKSQKRTKRLSTWKSAKPGKKIMGGDYGQAMMRYVGKLFNKNVRSVGYLKAIWVPVLRALAPFAKFKGYAKGLPYGVRWKTSSAIGAVAVAKEGTGNVAAVLDVSAHAPRMNAGAEAEVRRATQQALTDEAQEMRRHLESKLATAS